MEENQTKGPIVITSRWLEKHSACRQGESWFASRFPSGADIQDVLVLILCDPAADDSWVAWLMSRARYVGTEWITSLPEGLSVGGSLDLSGTGIKKSSLKKEMRKQVIW